MRKASKRLVSVFLCVVVMLSVMISEVSAASYSTQDITAKIEEYLNGKIDTKCPSGTTCWIFSRDLSYYIFGNSITFPSGTDAEYYLESKGNDYEQIGQVKNCDTQAVANLLKNALPGDVIQYASSFTNPYHTCIVKSISNSEIVIVEAATTNSVYYYRTRTIGLDADSIGKWDSNDLTRCGFGTFNSSSYGMTLYRYKNVSSEIDGWVTVSTNEVSCNEEYLKDTETLTQVSSNGEQIIISITNSYIIDNDKCRFLETDEEHYGRSAFHVKFSDGGDRIFHFLVKSFYDPNTEMHFKSFKKDVIYSFAEGGFGHWGTIYGFEGTMGKCNMDIKVSGNTITATIDIPETLNGEVLVFDYKNLEIYETDLQIPYASPPADSQPGEETFVDKIVGFFASIASFFKRLFTGKLFGLSINSVGNESIYHTAFDGINNKLIYYSK